VHPCSSQHADAAKVAAQRRVALRRNQTKEAWVGDVRTSLISLREMRGSPRSSVSTGETVQ
jgi:hypothetical protein